MIVTTVVVLLVALLLLLGLAIASGCRQQRTAIVGRGPIQYSSAVAATAARLSLTPGNITVTKQLPHLILTWTYEDDSGSSSGDDIDVDRLAFVCKIQYRGEYYATLLLVKNLESSSAKNNVHIHGYDEVNPSGEVHHYRSSFPVVASDVHSKEDDYLFRFPGEYSFSLATKYVVVSDAAPPDSGQKKYKVYTSDFTDPPAVLDLQSEDLFYKLREKLSKEAFFNTKYNIVSAASPSLLFFFSQYFFDLRRHRATTIKKDKDNDVQEVRVQDYRYSIGVRDEAVLISKDAHWRIEASNEYAALTFFLNESKQLISYDIRLLVGSLSEIELAGTSDSSCADVYFFDSDVRVDSVTNVAALGEEDFSFFGVAGAGRGLAISTSTFYESAVSRLSVAVRFSFAEPFSDNVAALFGRAPPNAVLFELGTYYDNKKIDSGSKKKKEDDLLFAALFMNAPFSALTSSSRKVHFPTIEAACPSPVGAIDGAEEASNNNNNNNRCRLTGDPDFDAVNSRHFFPPINAYDASVVSDCVLAKSIPQKQYVSTDMDALYLDDLYSHTGGSVVTFEMDLAFFLQDKTLRYVSGGEMMLEFRLFFLNDGPPQKDITLYSAFTAASELGGSSTKKLELLLPPGTYRYGYVLHVKNMGSSYGYYVPLLSDTKNARYRFAINTNSPVLLASSSRSSSRPANKLVLDNVTSSYYE